MSVLEHRATTIVALTVGALALVPDLVGQLAALPLETPLAALIGAHAAHTTVSAVALASLVLAASSRALAERKKIDPPAPPTSPATPAAAASKRAA